MVTIAVTYTVNNLPAKFFSTKFAPFFLCLVHSLGRQCNVLICKTVAINRPKTGTLQMPPPSDTHPAHYRFQNQGKNTVSSILGSYKSAITKPANRLGLPNGWQVHFHDHIIRNNAKYLIVAANVQVSH